MRAVAENPEKEQQLFSYAILGFGLTEAIALFGLMMAFLLLYGEFKEYPNHIMFNNLVNFIVKTLSTTDHKLIGQLYIYFGTISAMLGTFLSLIIRIQLTTGDGTSLLYNNTSFYNTVITMHGIVMIFMFVMPVLIGGFGNIFLPIMVGSPEMAFPRLNNISF
jgi:hypothetical protein